MQNTTADLVTGTTSSPKQGKTEEVLPRLTALNSTLLPTQEKSSLSLLQKITKFLRTLFSSKKAAEPKSQQAAAVVQPAIILPEKTEKPVVQQVKIVKPSPTTVILAAQGVTRTKYGTSLRKIAEQQFEEMDVSRATRN